MDSRKTDSRRGKQRATNEPSQVKLFKSNLKSFYIIIKIIIFLTIYINKIII